MSLPELGPLLGSLTSPAVPDGAAPDLDRVRLAMVTALFEHGAAARQLFQQGDTEGARRRIGAAAWIEIWDDTAKRSAALLMKQVEQDLRDAAMRSRYPKQRLARELPSAEDRAVLAARLSAAGLGLEAAAPLLDDPDAAWDPAVRRVAGELEQAWQRLLETAQTERSRWSARARSVAQWKRPWWPLLVGTGIALSLGVWTGLVLGGYLPVPGWFLPVAEWFWSLPWP